MPYVFSHISLFARNVFNVNFANFLFISNHYVIAIISEALMKVTKQKNAEL